MKYNIYSVAERKGLSGHVFAPSWASFVVSLFLRDSKVMGVVHGRLGYPEDPEELRRRWPDR